MTDKPDLTESQERVLRALAKAAMEDKRGFTDEELAKQLEMDGDELREHLQALADLGFVGRDVLDHSAPEDSPMPQCRRCRKPADGLDHLCTQCRAISACDHLVNNLSNALAAFLTARWSPHEYGKPRPAFYRTRPDFDGDPAQYLQQIAAAQTQLAAAAARLIKLAMPPGLRTKAEASYFPYYFGPDDYPAEFDGIHAAIDWGFAHASDPKPVQCKRVEMHVFVEMVKRGEVMLPGDSSARGTSRGRLAQQVTEKGLRELNEIPPEDWGQT
jgi:hypothetical protein